MSFDVSTLADYTQQNAEELITRSVFDAKTQKIIAQLGNIETGIKTSKTINKLETDAQFQNGAGCGFNASGTTSVTQRVLTVGNIKVNEALCVADLEAKYTQQALAIGSTYEEVPAPFEEAYTGEKIAIIAEQNEVAIWQGDTNSGNANLNKFDGFNKIIDQASGSVIHANSSNYVSGGPVASGTPLTGDTALAVVDAMWLALPAKIKGKKDVRIFCGWDLFEQYIMALKYKNLYHYSAESNEGEMTIPGTNYILVAVHGLDSTNRLFGLRVSTMYLGTDMEGEDEKFDMYYSKDNDNVRFIAKWKLGTQIGLPAEVVEFHRGA